MVWRRLGNKPLSLPMVVSLPTHICFTQPQCTKESIDQLVLVRQRFVDVVTQISFHWTVSHTCKYKLSNTELLLLCNPRTTYGFFHISLWHGRDTKNKFSALKYSTICNRCLFCHRNATTDFCQHYMKICHNVIHFFPQIYNIVGILKFSKHDSTLKIVKICYLSFKIAITSLRRCGWNHFLTHRDSEPMMKMKMLKTKDNSNAITRADACTKKTSIHFCKKVPDFRDCAHPSTAAKC